MYDISSFILLCYSLNLSVMNSVKVAQYCINNSFLPEEAASSAVCQSELGIVRVTHAGERVAWWVGRGAADRGVV